MNYTFFWAEPTCCSCPFSQWMFSDFTIGHNKYNSAEQWMMAAKARLFNDEETVVKIMQAEHPREQKKLGRQVKNFEPDVWEKNCRKLVYEGNYAKFTQHQVLKDALRDTIGTCLVESSPYDKVWGIGLKTGDPDCEDPAKWKGKNYLGHVLNQVRLNIFKDKKDKALCKELYGGTPWWMSVDPK